MCIQTQRRVNNKKVWLQDIVSPHVLHVLRATACVLTTRALSDHECCSGRCSYLLRMCDWERLVVVVHMAKMGPGVGVRHENRPLPKSAFWHPVWQKLPKKTKGADTSLKQFYCFCLKRVFDLHMYVVYLIFSSCVQQSPLIRNPLIRNSRLSETGFHGPMFTKDLVHYTFIRNSSYKYNVICFMVSMSSL